MLEQDAEADVAGRHFGPSIQTVCSLLEVEQRREQTGCSGWAVQRTEPLMKRDLDPGTHLNKGLSFGRGCIIPWCYSVSMVRSLSAETVRSVGMCFWGGGGAR